MEHSAVDCRCHAYHAEFTDPQAAQRSGLQIGNAHRDHLHLRHVGVHGYSVVRKVGVHGAAVATVNVAFIKQRLPEAHHHATDPLAFRQLRIEDSPAVEGGRHAFDADCAEVLVDADTKKPGRIVRPSHRVTGDRRDSVYGAVWETLFVTIDDHARIAFAAMHPDEKKQEAVEFLKSAVAYYAGLGVIVKRLLTDNGAAFRSREFAAACKTLGVQHKFTRPHRPQTNGKAERFIQSALREWAYGWTYRNSAERTEALAGWQHHYNWHRPHSGIGAIAPMYRLKRADNFLTVHSWLARAVSNPRAKCRPRSDPTGTR